MNLTPNDFRVHRIERLFSHQDKEGVVEFLNEELRPGAGFSIETEYPSLFGEFPGGGSVVLRKGNQIVAHAGYLVREVSHEDYRLRLGLIGSVVTTPDYRRLGLAGRVLEEVMSILRRRGCQLAMLWSDKTSYYGKTGFFRAGQEIDFRFSANDVPEFGRKPVLFDPKKHGAAVWRCYQKQSCRIDRSLEEQLKLFSIPKVQIYVMEGESGLESYLVLNRGADFRDYIHEWGGDVRSVAESVAYLQKHLFPARSLTLIAPAYAHVDPIRKIATQEWNGVLGLFRIVDRPNLLRTYFSYLRNLGLDFTWDVTSETLSIGSTEVSLKSDEVCLPAIFGSDAPSPIPTLPFFVWGFDSI